MLSKRIKSICLPISGSLCLIFIWWLINLFGFWDEKLFPNIQNVSSRFFELVFSGEIFYQVWPTLYRTILGFLIATFFGVPVGLFIGSNLVLKRMFFPVIDFFRSLPGTAMFPLFLLFFGIGDGSKIAISIFLSFWVILLSSIHGVLYVSWQRKLVAKSFGANKRNIFWDVTFREASPHIFSGLKMGISLSLIAVVVSEMFIGSSNGLGQKIYDSYLTYESIDLFSWLIVTGFVGFFINKIVSIFDRRFLHWANK
jgi:NitT/TauT family transport system permease protein